MAKKSFFQYSKTFEHKIVFFPNLSVSTYVLGAQKNRLIETVVLSTHNIYFGKEIKIFFSIMHS